MADIFAGYDDFKKKYKPPEAVPSSVTPKVTRALGDTPPSKPKTPPAKSGDIFDSYDEFKKQHTEEKPKDLMGEVGEALGSAYSQAVETAPSTVEGLEIGFNDLLAAAGIKGEEDLTNTAGFKWAAQQRAGQPVRAEDMEFEDVIAGAAGQLGAQAAISLGVAGTAGALSGPAAPIVAPIAGTVTGGILGMTAGASQAYREAKAFGADEKTARDMANWGGLIGATELIPVAKALKFLPPAVRKEAASKLMQKLMHVGMTGGEEGLQEGLSQLAQNFNAQQHGDINRGIFDNVVESSLVGTIAGTGLGAVTKPHVEHVGDKGGDPAQNAALNAANKKAPPPAAGTPKTPAAAVADGSVAPDVAAAAAAGVKSKGEIAAETSRLRDKMNASRPGVPRSMVPPAPASTSTPTPAGATPGAPPAPTPTAPGVTSEVTPPAEAPAPLSPEAPTDETLAANAEMGAGTPGEPPADAVAAGDTLDTVPEGPQTLEAQQSGLKNRKRAAVLYPTSSVENNTVPPPLTGKRFSRVELPGSGILEFDSTVATKKEVLAAHASGTLGQLLGLGPYTRTEVQQSLKPGEPRKAVIERTPAGVEVKAAEASDATSPEQVQAFEESKLEPENTVSVEPVEQVVGERVAATEAAPVAEEVTPEVTPPVDEPTQRIVPTADVQPQIDTIDESAELPPKMQRQLVALSSGDTIDPQAWDVFHQAFTNYAADNALSDPVHEAVGQINEAVNGVTPEVTQENIPTETPETGTETQINARGSRSPAKRRKGVQGTTLAGTPGEAPSGSPEAIAARVKIEREPPTTRTDEKGRTLVEVEPTPETAAEIEARERADIAEALRQEHARQQTEEQQKRQAAKEAAKAAPAPEFESLDQKVDRLAKIDNRGKTKIRKRLVSNQKAQEIVDEFAPRGDSEAAAARGSTEETPAQRRKIEKSMREKIAEAAKKGPEAEAKARDQMQRALQAAERGREATRAARTILQARLEAMVKAAEDRNVEFPGTQKGSSVEELSPNAATLLLGEARRILAAVKKRGGFDAAMARDFQTLEFGLRANDPEILQAIKDQRKAESESHVKPGAGGGENATASVTSESEGEGEPGAVTGEVTDVLSDVDTVTADEVQGSEGIRESETEGSTGMTRRRETGGEDLRGLVTSTGGANEGRVLSAEEKARISAHLGLMMKRFRDRLSLKTKLTVAERDRKLQALALQNINRHGWTEEQVRDMTIEEMLSTGDDTVAPVVRRLRASFTGPLKVGEGTAVEVMQSRLIQHVLNQMAKRIPDIRIVVVPDETFRLLLPQTGAYYNQATDQIVVPESLVDGRDNNEWASTFAHEGVHAMSAHAIDLDPALTAQLETLRKHVMDFHGVTAKDYYGLTDAHEFLAEMFSDGEFRALLEQTPVPYSVWRKSGFPVPSDPQLRNMLNWFKQFVSKLLGTGDPEWRSFLEFGKKDRSAFDLGLDIGGYILDVNDFYRYKSYDAVNYFPSNPPDTNVHRGPDDLLNIHAAKAKPAPKTTREQLEGVGIPSHLIDEFVDIIDKEYGGKLTKKELKDIAMEWGKPITSDKDLKRKAAVLPPAPPKDPNLGVTDVIDNKNLNKESPVRRFFLKLVTLDYMRQKWGDLFTRGDKRFFDNYALAIRKIEAGADEYAEKFNKLAVKFINFTRRNKDEGLEISNLAMAASRNDVQLGPMANNAHLGKKPLNTLQAKKILPELQRRFDALSPEGKSLYMEMVREYRNAHNAAKQMQAQNIIKAFGLDTRLTAAKAQEFVDKVVASKLGKADKEFLKAIGFKDAYLALKDAADLLATNGDYFPQMRFGDYVAVTIDKIEKPVETTLMLAGKGVTALHTNVNGNTVTFRGNSDIRGNDAALEQAVSNYIQSSPFQLIVANKRYRNRATGELHSVGEMDPKGQYDLTYEVKLQNMGVHYFESRSEAHKFAKDNKDSITPAGVMIRDDDQLATTVLGHSAQFAQERIDKNDRLTPMAKKAAKNAMAQAVISGLPGNRSPSKYIARRNVNGASNDLARAMMQYGPSHGGLMARLRYGPELSDARRELDAIKQKADMHPNGAAQKEVIAELDRRVLAIENPSKPHKIGQTIATLSFFGTLASPAHSMINATQVFMNTLPVLTGKYGNFAGTGAVLAAYKKIGTLGPANAFLRGGLNTAKAFTNWRDHALDTSDLMGSIRKKLGPKYAALIDELIARGSIDENAGFEVASAIMEARNPIMGTIARFDRAMRQMPAAVEVVNRTVTAVAAFDLALKSGMTVEEAINEAHNITVQTQFDYSKSNLPRFMKSRALGFAMQFRSYAIHQTQLYADMYQRIMVNADPKDRRVAMKQLLNLMLMQTLVAGAVGFPGSELLKVFFGIFGTLNPAKDDEWENAEQWMHQTLNQNLGSWGDILGNGAVSTFMGVDLSNRMSYSDLWTGFFPQEYDPAGWGSYIGSQFMGAPGQQMQDALVKAPQLLADGKTEEALETLVPIKIISDALKAHRKLTEGEYNMDAAIKQTIGFRSQEAAQAGTTKHFQYEETSRWNDERKKFYEQYNEAKTSGERAKIKSRIKDWNKKRKPKQIKDINIGGLEPYRLEHFNKKSSDDPFEVDPLEYQ